jgi:energy-coupling factor transporter ATP-binding protein EcfA2
MTTPHDHPLERNHADGGPVDFASFDDLVETLARWSGSLPDWGPARKVRAEWEQIEPRLDRARRELSRMLVVGVIGGTGVGKSTLVNALAGCDLSPAGDVARPTTINPVVVAARDVDLSWLPVDAMNARVVRSDAAAVANIVLVDCPDPDTQTEPGHAGGQPTHRPVRPSDSNHNRDLLEAVLPACDVLLLVSTAQKYRSWIVAREVNAFAPGRPLLFVQTHASRDPDIRDDWRRELESQGFVVPQIFRLDAVEATERNAAGLEPAAGFRELVEAIDAELVGRAARRVRRTGSLDLAGWFLRQSRESLDPLRQPVAQLAAGVASERSRLEGILARSVTSRLQASRSDWQRILTSEIVERWHGGPFASFLHIVESIIGFWPRVRAAGGGLISRLLAGQAAGPPPDGQTGWQAVADLGLSAAEVEQSRSVLCGLSARARLAEPLVGRARLDESRVAATVSTLLERAGAWLTTGIDRLVAERRGRIDGPVFRWVCEGLFSGLVVAVLARAGWNFFVGHLWQGRVVDGSGFLQEAFVWVILWGFLLRWIAFARVRVGLDGDIHMLVSRLPEAHLTDPLLADFATAAERTSRFIDEGDQLGHDHEVLVARLAEPASGLGRLRGETR